ncbi:hypothetical protein LTR66_011207, partial [Elasticomyces elasticus]
MASREYEIVLFGATGYTGKYTAEHITTNLPTDLKWAVAGRSHQKLQSLVEELKPLNPDRLQPAIEVAQLETADLYALARKTQLLISTVGPYYKYGTAVVDACANCGTHYLDVTGESPWVKEIIEKYHDVAQKNRAILIPQTGIESAPADLLTWALVSHIRQTLDLPTRRVTLTVHDMKAAPSGGTLATVLGLFDRYSAKQVADSMKPHAMDAVMDGVGEGQRGKSGARRRKGWVERVFGVRTVPGLGTLTTSLQ